VDCSAAPPLDCSGSFFFEQPMIRRARKNEARRADLQSGQVFKKRVERILSIIVSLYLVLHINAEEKVGEVSVRRLLQIFVSLRRRLHYGKGGSPSIG